jgi:hypothetical protein
MDLVAEDIRAIDFLSNRESLISGRLKNISIYYENNQLNIDLIVKIMYSKKSDEILIRFLGVIEYAFFYTSQNNFYFIEEYKLFNENNFFYLSLDPFDDVKQKNPNDNDYIIATNIQLFTGLKLD